MKNNSAKSIEGKAFCRVQFRNLQAGDKLFRAHGSIANQMIEFGDVTAIETDAVGGATKATLSTGERMTRRGWQNKRLWKLAR